MTLGFTIRLIGVIFMVAGIFFAQPLGLSMQLGGLGFFILGLALTADDTEARLDLLELKQRNEKTANSETDTNS